MPKEKNEFELARKKRRRRLFFERAGRMLLALVLIAALVFGIYKAIDSDLIGVLSDRAAAAASKGLGLPVELAGSTVRCTFECNGSIGLVSDTAYYLYGKNGVELLSGQHGMTQPCADASGRRFLLFDRGGTKLLVRTRDRVLFEYESPFSIVDAQLSKNGWLTVVTGSQRYSSRVAVFEPSYKETAFTWDASGEYVLSAAVGPDDRTVAAVSVGASGGEIYSVLHIFAVDAPEELAQRRLDGSTALDVSFSSYGDIRLVCDDRTTLTARDGSPLGEYEYPGALLSYACAADHDPAVLIFDKYKETRACEAVILGDKCAVLSDTQVEGLVSGALASGSEIVINTPGRIYVYDPAGKPTRVSEDGPEALKLLLVDGDVYAVGRGELFAPAFAAAPAEG